MRTWLAIPLLLGAASPARGGDILCLKDGRIIEGPKMERKPTGIELTYAHGTILVPSEMILDAVLDTDKPPPPQTDEEREMTSRGMVRFENKWITPKQREDILQKRIAARHAELEQIAARHEWRNRAQQDTAHFHFEYTVPDFIFEEYRDLMESYFSEFMRVWKLKPPGRENRLPVCLYADEQAFHQVGGVPPNVLGYFRYVKPWDLNIYYERLDPELSTEVMFHESNHYLQQLIDLKFAVPHFPGESLAEYYGASHWDPEKKKLTTGLVLEGRLCEVQDDIARGDWEKLEDLVRSEGDYKHYTWGWSLVYYLMNDARYQPKFQNFVFTLARGKGVRREPLGRDNLSSCKADEVWRVFKDELGLKDDAAVKNLERDWHAFVKKLEPASLRGIEKAGLSAADTGERHLRALRLLKDAIDKGSRNPLVFERYANELAAKGKRGEALEALQQALGIDPLNGELYARLGFSMLVGKKDDPKNAEANRLLALAKDLGYDGIWIDLDPDSPTVPK